MGALGVSLLYIFSPWHTTRVSHESSPQEFSTRMSAPQKKSCVSCKSVPQDRATKGVPQVQTLPHKIAHKSVPQKLSTRVSYKSVPQECCARAFHKSGPRECPMFPSPNGTGSRKRTFHRSRAKPRHGVPQTGYNRATPSVAGTADRPPPSPATSRIYTSVLSFPP